MGVPRGGSNYSQIDFLNFLTFSFFFLQNKKKRILFYIQQSQTTVNYSFVHQYLTKKR